MNQIKPPIYPFEELKPITTTIISNLDVTDINLKAIFGLLPVSTKVIDGTVNMQRKQGKIKIPTHMNEPGEILSMRYANEVRGIVRSEKPICFPNAIIMDIGTSDRIISIKLSKSIELNGPTSIGIAREATENLISKIKGCQEDIDFLKNNNDVAVKLAKMYINKRVYIPETGIEERIYKIYMKYKDYENSNKIIEFLTNYPGKLYTGSLTPSEYKCEMANICFNLGYTINQVSLARLMDNHPFKCRYTNLKSMNGVNINYEYKKYDQYTNKEKIGHHTINVNQSGYVKYSGPGLEAMKRIYYIFMQRIVTNQNIIESCQQKIRNLKIMGKSKCLSVDDWNRMINKENELRESLLKQNFEVEIISKKKEISKIELTEIDLIKFEFTPIKRLG